MSTRYFLFSFQFTADTDNGFGQVTFIANGMPRLIRVIEVCKKQVTDKLPNTKNVSVVIIGLNEFSKRDYNSFVS